MLKNPELKFNQPLSFLSELFKDLEFGLLAFAKKKKKKERKPRKNGAPDKGARKENRKKGRGGGRWTRR